MEERVEKKFTWTQSHAFKSNIKNVPGAVSPGGTFLW
jgi:hypothetical protein